MLELLIYTITITMIPTPTSNNLPINFSIAVTTLPIKCGRNFEIKTIDPMHVIRFTLVACLEA